MISNTGLPASNRDEIVPSSGAGADVVSAVRGFLRELALPEGTVVTVGVSGGPDSVALLHAFCDVAREWGVGIHVVHVNHGLRGADSDGDAEFVRGLGAELYVPVTVHVADVGAFALAKRVGVEEAARELRYRAFAETMTLLGSPLLCLGHNANDQVETILLHLLRGTGLDGLVGMRPLAPFPRMGETSAPLRVGRPLLDVPRRDVERYLSERHISFRVDHSNLDTDMTRNRLRSDIVPVLASINPGMMAAVNRMVGLLREDQAFIESWVDERWAHVCLEESGDKVTFEAVGLAALPRSLQTRLLRRAVSRLRDGDIRDVTAAHLGAAIELLGRARTGTRLDWPRGLSVAMSYETMEVRSQWTAPSFDDLEVRIKVPGRTEVLGLNVRVTAIIADRRCMDADLDPWHADLDAEKTGATLFIRRRRQGDRMIPLGMMAKKKLQDIMVDAKIRRDVRDRIPIVHDGDAIVWAAGLRIGDEYKVGSSTVHFLCLRMESLDGASLMPTVG